MNEKNINTAEQNQRLGARSLLKKLFSDSHATLNEEENGTLTFSYKNDKGSLEYFVVEANDEHSNIRICDFCWHEVSKWDIEEVTRIQSQINALNSFERCKVVYHFDDNDKMLLTTILTCPLLPEIPDIFSYFTAQLETMLRTHDFILNQQTEESSGNESVSNNDIQQNKEQGGEA